MPVGIPTEDTWSLQGVSSVMIGITLASRHLLAHARVLAAKTEGEFHQVAVVLAHAACELHTEWALNKLLDARPDKTLVDLVLPANRDVTSLETDRSRRVYSALTGDNPTEAEWWGGSGWRAAEIGTRLLIAVRR
jgi:hypothetical protein